MKQLRKIIEYFGWSEIHPVLFIFLVLVMNVKMLIKIPVILLLGYLNRKQFSAALIKKEYFSWFYAAVILLTLINFLINLPHFSFSYALVTVTGLFYWFLMIITALSLFVIVNNTDKEKLNATVELFFKLNIIVTGINFFFVLIETGLTNPYTYQGNYQKFFINTGDYIRGISFDTSTTNAIICSFGLIYFLYRHKFSLSLLCLTALLLTTSNLANIMMVVILGFIFAFFSNRDQKSIILLQLFVLLVFMIKVTPQNSMYIINKAVVLLAKKNKPETAGLFTEEKKNDLRALPDSLLNKEDRKRKKAVMYLDSISLAKLNEAQKGKTLAQKQEEAPLIRELPKININADFYQHKTDTAKAEKFSALKQEVMKGKTEQSEGAVSQRIKKDTAKLPGKVLSFIQTYNYFKAHPAKTVTGNGTGAFSSKLAFKATALNIYGSYPKMFEYISPAFRSNHLLLFINYFSKDEQEHSVINTPNSVYNQLIGEYGMAGFAAFFIFYLFYFFKKSGVRGYGLPLLLLLCGSFVLDYFFEQFSIVILFELLMLLNIKTLPDK